MTWPFREEGGAWCLACHGEGVHDFRDSDAMLGEHLPPHVIERLRTRPGWKDVVRCEECEGTGIITVDRARDMLAVSRAAIDQIIARVEEEERA